MLFTD
jgi:hypothetical protein